MKNRKRKAKLWVAVFVALLGLTGCSSTELEERSFPMLVTAGFDDRNVSYGVAFSKEETITKPLAKGESFQKSKEKYESRLNKDPDYNHLKVLVFEEDLLEQPTVYDDVLAHLSETEEYPRNTYVCVVDDTEDLMELEKNITQDLGTYIEEYLKKHEERKDKLLTLGDLIDERENQTFILYLPYLEIEDNFVEWKGYVNTSGKSWQESK